MRKTAEHLWTDCKTNTEVTKEPNITTVLDKVQEYRRHWFAKYKQNGL
jgi:hypothetical protein